MLVWVVGAMLALGVFAPDVKAAPIEVVDTRSGIDPASGRPFIQVELAEPFPEPGDQFSAFVAFSLFTPDNVHLTGFSQFRDGAASDGGEFAPDSTQRPSQPAPGFVEVVFSADRRIVTFLLTAPPGVTLDPATLRYRNQTGSLEQQGAQFEVLTVPADGSLKPFDTTERDPFASTTPTTTTAVPTTTAAPTTTAVPTTDPPSTVAPTTVPAVIAPPDGADEDDGGMPFWLWILIVLAALGALLGVATWQAGRRKLLDGPDLASELQQARTDLAAFGNSETPDAERQARARSLVEHVERFRDGVPRSNAALRSRGDDLFQDVLGLTKATREPGLLDSWSLWESWSGATTTFGEPFVPDPGDVAAVDERISQVLSGLRF